MESSSWFEQNPRDHVNSHWTEQTRIEQFAILRPQLPAGERVTAGRTGTPFLEPCWPSLERAVCIPWAVWAHLLVAEYLHDDLTEYVTDRSTHSDRVVT